MSAFEPQIRAMTPNDLDDVTLIHHRAFPDFFMTLLGSSFLRSYYLTVLEYEKAISLVAVDENGKIVGFAVGFVEPDKFYRFFKTKLGRFFVSTLSAFIRKPYLLKRILGGFSRVNKSKLVNSSDALCELSSIGVAKIGAGVGKVLLEGFIELCFLKGTKELVLTTDLNNNDGVIAFYKAKGFVQSGIDVRGNREMIQFMLRNPKNSRN